MTNLRTLTIKLKAGLSQLPYLPRSLSLIWTATQGWMLAWAILLIVQGLLPVATVYLTQQLVDSLVAALNAGEQEKTLLLLCPSASGVLCPSPFTTTLVLVVLMGGVLLLTQVLGSVQNWVRTVQSELVKDYISTLIHQKSLAVDFAFYESPAYYDRLHRVRLDAHHRPVRLLEASGSLLQNSITLIAMAAILTRFGMWLPVALWVSTLPAFYAVVRYSLRQHAWWLRTTTDERLLWYYDWLLTAGETAAEMRLFNLGEYFQSAFQRVRLKLRQERLQLTKDESWTNLSAGAVALLITGLASAWMVWQAILRRVTLGDLALFYQAFNQGQGVMRSLLENLGQIYSNVLFLSNLFEFLALEPQIEGQRDRGDGETGRHHSPRFSPLTSSPSPLTSHSSLKKSICFHQVTFCYPGSDRPVLENFNLTIPAGKIVAIVGENGAGKSTLIKLLCRLYDPQIGYIEWDGINLRDLSVRELRRQIAVLFQQPVRYYATVAENIALGDWAASPTLTEITAAAIAAGADEPIARLPMGYDTLLGKLFEGGMELSGGEWQRIALARAFLHQAPLIILDEPTSALDSWAEADWLKRFRQLAFGRTAIIITHRFTIAKQADIIHVMAKGQIVESGCHDELLASGCLYAQSWKRQIQEEF